MFLTGNEAVARGAYEAGVSVSSAYPGTPSTEIIESIGQYNEIYSEWGTNEKVAYEVAYGACIAGKRSLACMKQVGLNVAADPFFTSVYTGVNGGFVVVTADEPGVFSSQNEQDNRNYGKAAKCPVIEPSDSQECIDFIKLSYELSEKFDVPVLFRITTRICHTHGIVNTSDRLEIPKKEYVKDSPKRAMIPVFALKRHEAVEKRLSDIKEWSDSCDFNTVINKNSNIKTGIITSGNAFNYVMENFDNYPIFKLGMVYPLPEKSLIDFCENLDEIIIIEENDDFLYENIKLINLNCNIRKKPSEFIIDELSIEKVKASINSKKLEKTEFNCPKLPPRPPQLCPACPHRALFFLLSKHKLKVTGDIGCYGLGVLPPFHSMDTIICMGASITMSHGFALAGEKAVGVIGDSTFFHTGINGIINTFYNKGVSTVFILDNSITAMTGGQINPSSNTLSTSNVDIEKIIKAIGIDDVKVIDAFNVKEIEIEVRASKENTGLKVVILRQPCIMIRKEKAGNPRKVDQSKCIKCKLCLKVGCPAITMQNGEIRIMEDFCLGCNVCAQVCPKGAIHE